VSTLTPISDEAPAGAARGKRAGLAPGDQIRLLLPVGALLVIVAVIFALQPQTRSYFGLTLLFSFSIPLVFAAMAQLCVIAAGDIDLGIGPFISLVNCIAVTFLYDRPALGVLALVGCVAAYIIMGAIVEVRGLPSIVVTLGASFIWLGLAVMLLPSAGGTAPAWLPALLSVTPPLIPLALLVAAIVGALGHFLFFATSYGAVLRGVGGNARAVKRAGWSLLRARTTMYGMAGFCGVLAGLAITGLNTSGDANIGTQYTLISIAAVIVGGGEFFGGIVSPIGAVVGSMIMLLTGSLLSFLNVSSAWQLSVQGVVLIAVLATRAVVRRRPL
jgi:ribose/xylose/arabinose/galactoside ABC-type transport system permease subunit